MEKVPEKDKRKGLDTMALLDFLKTQSNNQNQSNQWDWGGKIIPLAMMIGGAGANMMNGYQQGRQSAMDQKRQSNLDEWNKMIQDEQLKKLQRENETVDITKAMGEQFKGTKYEPFIWSPAETKTQSQEDYLAGLGIVNQGGTNLTGSQTIEKPESLRTTSMNKQDYLSMVNDVEGQKATKEAADLKALLEQQKLDAQTRKEDEDRRRWEKEYLLDEERVSQGWVNKDNKPKEPSPEQRKYMESIASTAGQYRSQNDYLADLSRNRDKIIQQIGVDGYQRLVDDATKNSSTIWNVNKGVKDKKGNTILVGGQYKQGQGSPMASLFGGSPRMLLSKTNNNQPKPQSTPVKTVQLKDKKTGNIITGFVGIRDGKYYSTEGEARTN